MIMNYENIIKINMIFFLNLYVFFNISIYFVLELFFYKKNYISSNENLILNLKWEY